MGKRIHCSRLWFLQAFADLPNVALGQLAKHIGAPFGSQDPLFARLLKLLHFVLPDKSEQELVDIMQRRIHVPSLIEAYLTSDGADDILMDDDRKELQKDKEAKTGASKEQAKFAQSYVEKRKELKDGEPAKKKNKETPEDRDR